MPIFAWNNNFACGIQAIDEHHRVLVDLISRLHDAMRVGKGSQEAGAVLDQLVDYTVFHFNFEEKLMTANGYPESARHQSAHAALTRQVKDFQKEFHSQKIGLSIRLINFLKDWLTNHILMDDKQLAAFLIASGIK